MLVQFDCSFCRHFLIAIVPPDMPMTARISIPSADSSVSQSVTYLVFFSEIVNAVSGEVGKV